MAKPGHDEAGEELKSRLAGLESQNQRLREFLGPEAEKSAATHDAPAALLRLLTEQLQDVIWIVDLQPRVVYASPSTRRLRGFTPEEVLVQRPDEILAPDSLETARNIINSLLDGASEDDLLRSPMEIEMLHKEGHGVWTESLVSLLRDPEGRPAGFLGISRDITDRRRVQQELQERNALLENILANLHQIFFSLDVEKMRLEHMSSACEAIYGLPVNAFLKNPMVWFELILPEDQERIGLSFSGLRSGALDESLEEYRIQRPDGQRRWLRSRIRVRRSPQGTVTHFDGFITDISMRKRLEEQLLQSQKMEAVGTLAGGVAHDMNNVLGVVMGLASVLQLGLGEDHPLSRHVEGILAASRRGRDLTRNLLGFARKGQYHTESLSLNDIVEEVLALLERTVPKSIVIRTALDGALDPVRGDSGQLNHALMNLCLNACDAMSSGGTITITTRNVQLPGPSGGEATNLPPGRYALLRVADSGGGMSQETMARAFEPFFTTKPKGRGTGLGLAMVYGTVQGHGGAVHLESEPDRGTRATLLLPTTMIRSPRSRRLTPMQEETAAQPRGVVLLVDDEELFRVAGELMLRQLGYDVVTVPGGVDAVAALETSPTRFSVVLLDLQMPGLDGEETYNKIREIAPELPVLLCSGYSLEDKAGRLMAAGAQGFLQKPFDVPMLRQALGQALAPPELS